MTPEIGQLPFPAGEIERIARGLRQKPKGERATPAERVVHRALLQCTCAIPGLVQCDYHGPRG